MDDEKLKKKIERQFDKELNKLGITDFTFERRDSLPEESELAKKSQYIQKIGKVGKYLFWVVKCGAAAIYFFVTVAILPDSVERFKVNYPDTYQVVQDIGKMFDKNEIPIQDQKEIEKSIQLDINRKYIAYKKNWFFDKDLYNQDIKRLEKEQPIFEDDRSTLTLFPSSGTPPEIANSCNLSTTFKVGLSDWAVAYADDSDEKA